MNIISNQIIWKILKLKSNIFRISRSFDQRQWSHNSMKMIRNALKMIREWFENASKMVRTCSENGPVQLSENDLKMYSKSLLFRESPKSKNSKTKIPKLEKLTMSRGLYTACNSRLCFYRRMLSVCRLFCSGARRRWLNSWPRTSKVN